jgi:predicted nucleic acid-binding protein
VPDSYVLDSYALLSYFNSEPAGKDVKRLLEAAEIKAKHMVSYADAFGAALAQELRAKLVTGDPEFKKLEPELAVMWLL